MTTENTAVVPAQSNAAIETDVSFVVIATRDGVSTIRRNDHALREHHARITAADLNEDEQDRARLEMRAVGVVYGVARAVTTYEILDL